MKKTSVGIIASMLFMVLAIGALYYLWRGEVQNADSAQTADTAAFAAVEISGIKEAAAKLVTGNDNNAGLPIAVPTAKLGKPNPFKAPE